MKKPKRIRIIKPYVFAKMKFRGKRFMHSLVMLTQFIPVVIMFLLSRKKLADNLAGGVKG